MDRRTVLKGLATLPFTQRAGTLFAASNVPARLLFIFLRGGYDAATLLVPVTSQLYYQTRPNIAVPRPGSTSSAALALDVDWGLHPALHDTVYPLFQQQQVAFVPFAGTEDVSRSHFETQDILERGQGPQQRHRVQSGFLNRLVAVLTGVTPMAFTAQLPLVLRGHVQVPNMALQTLGKVSLSPRQSRLMAEMYHDTHLAAPVREGLEIHHGLQREFAEDMEAASRQAISTQGFALEAQRIARLMQEKFTLGFVDVGGWDTHVNQGGASGALAERLAGLGRGLAAFAEAMGSVWSKTVVVVMSEFGRTLRENGNRGTDHGHGTVYWVLGGSIHGGRMAGEQTRVEQHTLFQDRDYPVLNEYRAVFSGLFARLYGLSPRQLDRVFAGVSPQDIGLV